MKIYFASGFVYMNNFEDEKRLYDYGARNRLWSYYDILSNKHFTETFYKVLEAKLFNLFIDSGAYAAMTRGLKIDIEEYGKFLLAVKDNPGIDVYVNLDVKPSSSAKNPSPDRFDIAAQKGWENLKYLESIGLKPIHVYHYGESQKYLDQIIDNYEYFGLASTTGTWKGKEIFSWLDSFWSRMTDQNGKPLRRVHAFGLTSFETMIKYPWYSVDSSTWGRTGVFGSIQYPAFVDGHAVNKTIGVSPHSTYQRLKHAHYKTLSPMEQKKVREWVESCGLTIEQLLNEDKRAFLRDRVNIRFFLMLQDRMKDFEKKSGFSKGFFE